MEGRGEPGCRGGEGEGAGRTLGEEGRWEGEGRPGGVGQPCQQGGGGGHALAGHRHRPGEERGALLLDHLVILSPPFGLVGITTGVNLHSPHHVRYQRASSFFQLLVNLLKTVRSADKVPSPSLVLLPISIPGQLQPFEWQRLQSRPLATSDIKPIGKGQGETSRTR